MKNAINLAHFLFITTILIGNTVSINAQQRSFIPFATKASEVQYKKAVNEYPDPNIFPRSTKPDGSLYSVNSADWCSGFFAGSLWLLYDLTKDVFYKNAAQKWSVGLEKEQHNKSTHDLGFMMYNSFGTGYKLTGDKDYKKIIIQSAKSLASRFHPHAGVIRSWDFGSWQYPVIIDNMMNLELLFEGSKLSGDDSYRQIAIKHADHTMQNHFRKDYSSYHVVDYDSITGKAIKKQTNQGYADESAWARGQSWGLYGFTVMYRYTKDKKYLDQAEHIATFILNHPNLPKDKIPYWDFNDPKIPDTYRDASAAAIIASALLELRKYVGKEKGEYYFKTAETILTTLSTPEYLADNGNGNFVLRHCVGNWPKGKATGEIDAAINYGDYYYLEALLRYKQEIQEHTK
jgi:unsaturated chondroitin disaccharide hydrolase